MQPEEFRGRRKDNGDLVYGHGFFVNNAVSGFPVSVYSDKFFKWYKVDPGTVDHFSGLLDRNGLKIFGRDIVRDGSGNVGVVFYSGRLFGWRVRFIKGRPDLLVKPGVGILPWVYPRVELEVVGNVHDRHMLSKAPNARH